MIFRSASYVRVGLTASVFATALACSGEPDASFDLGGGAFPWKYLVVTMRGDLGPDAAPPAAPPSGWRGSTVGGACGVSGIIYGIGWIIPCEGSMAAAIGTCQPDPDFADGDLCPVTLESFAATLHPDYDEPVLEAAKIELVSPVSTVETWSVRYLGGTRTRAAGALIMMGRNGGGPTSYDLSSFELRLDDSSSQYSIVLQATKSGG